MNSKWRILVCIAAMAALGVLASRCENRKIKPMDTTGWKTHCIGRFLVDLPPNAKVGGIYQIWGNPIERASVPASSITQIIGKREEELKASPHDTRGTKFIRREDYPSGGASLLSYDMAESEDFLHIDTYMVAMNGKHVFLRSALVEPEKERTAFDFARQMNDGLQEIATGEIPKGPGFCIDRALIAGDEFRSEVFNVGVTLPQHPGMNITLLATTQGEVDKETLLDRTGATEVALLAQGAKRLRKGKRAAGGGTIPGEEYLMTSTEDGQKKYGFAWESPGKAESVAEPYMTVELQVLGQSVVDEDHPYKPPFASDDEALELWDAIIESLRPRPGAAIRRQ
ncbi:MAG: T6SS immunity protein Tli4 family protein [Pseudoxanthomonas sp.]